MNLTKVSVECKRSKDYQTESVSMEATIEPNETPAVMVKLLQKWCRELAEEQLATTTEIVKNSMPHVPKQFGGK